MDGFKLNVCLGALLTVTLSACSGTGDSEVFISTGSKQCLGDGNSLIQSRRFLDEMNIEVFDSQCGLLTGVGFTTVCGAPTGEIHIFTIAKDDVEDAINIGFSDASSLEEGVSYKVVGC